MIRFRFVLLAAVAVHLALGLGAVRQKSITTDELFHLAGGYCFNALGDFRIHPDNGVLPQRLHALPAVLLGAHPPPLDTEAWRTADATVVGYDFLYRSGHDHAPLLAGARAVNALFGAALVVLVGLWARRLGGALAGTVSAALAALSPTLLAHGPLATTDAAAAFFLTAAAGAFWHWLGARTPAPRPQRRRLRPRLRHQVLRRPPPPRLRPARRPRPPPPAAPAPSLDPPRSTLRACGRPRRPRPRRVAVHLGVL